jgi:hypothetical protein
MASPAQLDDLRVALVQQHRELTNAVHRLQARSTVAEVDWASWRGPARWAHDLAAENLRRSLAEALTALNAGQVNTSMALQSLAGRVR